MLKNYSALDSNYTPGSYPTNRKITVKFKENDNLNLIQLASWSNTLNEAENFIKKELNLNYTPGFNRGIIEKEYSLWRIEPLKWWILKKELDLPEELGTNLDISHAFTCTTISGNNATLLLNRFLPILNKNIIFNDFYYGKYF